INNFNGNDPKKWRTNVSTYAKVKYRDVYPGIDLVHYGNQRQLEYDFVVAPGADPKAIRFGFEGAEKMEIDGTRREVSGTYSLSRKNQVSFEVGKYNPGRPLVIDPTLSYSTYLGGNDYDAGEGIALDSAGNAYVTGFAYSTNFPAASPFQGAIGGSYDAF